MAHSEDEFADEALCEQEDLTDDDDGRAEELGRSSPIKNIMADDKKKPRRHKPPASEFSDDEEEAPKKNRRRKPVDSDSEDEKPKKPRKKNPYVDDEADHSDDDDDEDDEDDDEEAVANLLAQSDEDEDDTIESHRAKDAERMEIEDAQLRNIAKAIEESSSNVSLEGYNLDIPKDEIESADPPSGSKKKRAHPPADKPDDTAYVSGIINPASRLVEKKCKILVYNPVKANKTFTAKTAMVKEAGEHTVENWSMVIAENGEYHHGVILRAKFPNTPRRLYVVVAPIREKAWAQDNIDLIKACDNCRTDGETPVVTPGTYKALTKSKNTPAPASTPKKPAKMHVKGGKAKDVHKMLMAAPSPKQKAPEEPPAPKKRRVEPEPVPAPAPDASLPSYETLPIGYVAGLALWAAKNGIHFKA